MNNEQIGCLTQPRNPQTGRFEMAEGAITATKEAVMAPVHHPWKWIVGGLIFMVFVFILEAFKPGIITGPIKSFVGMFGIKTA